MKKLWPVLLTLCLWAGTSEAACWTVPAMPIRTVDGDTFIALVEVWLSSVTNEAVKFPERIRLLGVETPEMTGITKPAGEAAKAFTQAWLAKGPIQIVACYRDSFGRVLGKVTRGTEDLTQLLIQSGNGVPR